MLGMRLPAALRHRDFALLWSGQSISLVGDGVFTVALAVQTLRVSGSPAALSFVLAARALPTVCLLLLGGVIVDRIPRRVAMLTSDLTRGLVVAGIAVGAATGELRLWELITMAAIFGAADALFLPASTAIVPELLPAHELVNGSALTSGSQQGAQRLAGPALGGIIVASLGTAAAFGVDAASFAVSAACLAVMTARPGRGAAPGRSVLADARAGLRYCWSQPWLWVSIIGSGVVNFAAFSPLLVLVPVLVRHVLGQGPAVLGLVLAAGGAGGVAGSLVIARLGAPRLRVTAMWLAWGGASAGVIALGFAPDGWVAGLVFAVVWALVMYGGVLWSSLIQQRVPAELLGRVGSVDLVVSFAASPIGLVVAGLVAGGIGARAALVAGGGLAALMTFCLVVPGVRDPERPDLVEAAPGGSARQPTG